MARTGIGANLFSDCLIALDARTGKRLWHFQTTHHDLWDFDNNAAPQLTTIRHNGRNVDVVALAGKTGFLYVFDRVTGTPIWPIEERPVPKGDMPGEEYWPTQPFPTNPPPFARQSFSIDDVSSLSNVAPAARQQLLERLATAKNVGLFTPISTEWTVHIPGNNGGALFGTTSAEPTTGRVYVVGQNNPAVLRLYKPGEGPARGGGPGASPGQAVYQRYCQQCHGADRAGTPTGSTLLTVPGRLDADTLRELITNGRGQMPPFAHLSAEELTQLMTYVLSPPLGRGGRARAARRTRRRPRGVRASTGARRGDWRRQRASGWAVRPSRRAADLPGRRAAVRAVLNQWRVRNDRQSDEAAVHDDYRVRPEQTDHSLAGRIRRRSVPGG